MKVVILCGGYGTRIREVSEDLPKPMIPVGDKPILWHLMKRYADYGFNEFVLCLGHKGNVIKNFFLNYQENSRDVTVTIGEQPQIKFHGASPSEDWKVTLVDTGDGTLTGSRIRKIKKYVESDENFLLTYGDGLSNVDLSKLVEFHEQHKKIITVTGVRPPGRFGELATSKNGEILEFNEKPQASGGRISGGFFVCRNNFFDYLGEGDKVTFEDQPMRALVKEKQAMMFEHDGFWQCMDTHRDWVYLNDLVKTKEAPWMVR